jgi:helicase
MEINDLTELGIPQEFIAHFEEENIKTLYPPQVQAIKQGLLSSDRNFVLAFPTASGKTLMATLAAIKALEQKAGKAVYIVPLIALANEKYVYYKGLLSGFKVALAVGDMDSPQPWLGDYDFIIATTEKFDSLIRHGISWLSQIKLIIIDEVHLLNDYKRGPTLEILITQLRRLSSQARILALSATINNARELSQWLEAGLVVSSFRPVKLYEGIHFESAIQFVDKKGYLLDDNLDPETAITENTLRLKKQVLFFVSRRRNAEALAERLEGLTRKFIEPAEKERFCNLEKEVLSALETPTHQCRRLAKCVKGGAAFHHAGLLSRQKRLIEEGFRQGLIRLIVATPTLALGVNLPCFRVVVRDIKRFSPGLGSEYIPVLEYKQFVGRAGRPQYDKFGEAILLARTEKEKDTLIERYILGEPEDIDSKLAQEAVLRMHILSLIAGEFCSGIEDLNDFFKATFFGFQYQDVSLLKEKIESVLRNLMNWQFVYPVRSKSPKATATPLVRTSNGVDSYSFPLKASRLGKRIAQLYLDPQTAYNFILALKTVSDLREVSNLCLLQIISIAGEMSPGLRLGESEQWKLNEFLLKEGEQFIDKPPSMWEDGYDEFLASVKLALMFEAWISEEDEEFILDKFKVTPGELYTKRETADWLVYSLTELAHLLKLDTALSRIKKLRIQLHYGVRGELLELVSLRDIGRKRARKLFQAGFKSIAVLREASEKQLTLLLGSRLARSIKEQILLPSGSKKRYNK